MDSLATLVLIATSASVLDAILTLTALRTGATEANPIMAAALTLGPITFVAIKALLPVGLLSLLATIHHASSRALAQAAALLYIGCCLWTAYHLL